MTNPEPYREYYEWECGCYYERKSPDEFRFRVCSLCWDAKMELLDNLVLDQSAQLTLLLSSDTSRAGAEANDTNSTSNRTE